MRFAGQPPDGGAVVMHGAFRERIAELAVLKPWVSSDGRVAGSGGMFPAVRAPRCRSRRRRGD